MALTIDCGEGKHDLCVGYSHKRYLIPQLDGEPFQCACSCHTKAIHTKGTESLSDYLNAVVTAAEINPEWRLGQTYFNILREMRPDLSEQIRTTEMNPFNDDYVIPTFIQWVDTHW